MLVRETLRVGLILRFFVLVALVMIIWRSLACPMGSWRDAQLKRNGSHPQQLGLPLGGQFMPNVFNGHARPVDTCTAMHDYRFGQLHVGSPYLCEILLRHRRMLMIPNRDVFNFEVGLAIVGHEVGRQLIVQL